MASRLMVSASLVALASLGFAVAPAAAQSAPPASAAPQADNLPADSETPAIVVTGFRASLASSLTTKRTASAIVDTISSEDIGKFPEQNMAESLQRITGVQISRSKGEGQNISIRGLSPDFNQINLNGRALPSPTGSRSFDFTILSSDFINGIDVYKTPTADIEEGGLAGTVNVRTLRPADVKGFRMVANVEGLYEGNAKKVSPHASLLVADRFLDNRLSVIVGVDYSKRYLQTYSYQAFGLETASEAAKNLDYNLDGQRNGTFLINHAASFLTEFGTRERLSGIVSVGYEVSDTFNLWAEALGSRFTNDIHSALNAHRFTNINDPNGIVASTIDSRNILTTLDANGVDNRNNGRPSYYQDTLQSYAVGGSWNSGAAHLDVEASYGRARRIATDVSLEVISRASVQETLSSNPDDPATVTYQRGYDPLDRANWRALGLNGTYKQPTTDTTKEIKADFRYDVEGSFFKAFRVGLAVGQRSRDVVSQQLFVSAQDLAPLLGETYSPTIEGGSFAAGNYMVEYNFPNPLGKFLPTHFLSSDPRLVFNKLPLDGLASQFGLTKNLAQTYSVREDTLAGYARADFASGDSRLTGNFGVRVVRTKQRSDGYAPDLSEITFNQQGATTTVPVVTPVSVSRSYTYALPSFNARYKLTDNIDLRFGAARVLSRPTLSILAPNTTVNANVSTINYGNPNVKPYTSDQFDVSAEWYFGQGALLSLAGFYKDVNGFIVSTSTPQTLQIKQAQGGGTIAQTFNTFQPKNGGNAKIKGFEISLQQPFTFLPAPFDGFGIIANYTFVSADKVPTTAGGTPLPLPGVSKNNYNLVAYYEKGPVGLRLSYNYRDKFVVDNYSSFGDGQYTSSYHQLDLSSNFSVNDRIELNVDVLNLTKSVINNVDIYGINRGVEDNGRRVTFGARVKF